MTERVVDLGAGRDPDPRATLTLDVDPAAEPDLEADLRDEWPLEAASVDGLVARHVVEHFDTGDVAHFFREAARVLVDRGWLEVTVPIGVAAATDPDHAQRWTYRTPTVYCREHSAEKGRHWDPDVPLRLTGRDVDARLIGPLTPLTPLLRLAGRKWPGWAVYRAGAGELAARYERLPRSDSSAAGEGV